MYISHRSLLQEVAEFSPSICAFPSPHLLLRRHGPDALERQLGLQLLVELVVLREDGLEQVVLRPQPHPEEARGQLLLHVGLEAAPGDEQPLLRAELVDGPDELVHGRAVDGGALGLDLHAQPRLAEAQRPGAGEDVGAAVGALRAAVRRVALRLEDGLHQARQAVPLEPGVDEPHDGVPRRLLAVVRALGQRLGVGAAALRPRDRREGLRLPAAGPHRLEARLRVVALHAADGHERAEGVQQVLAEVIARDGLADPLHGPPMKVGVRPRRLEAVVAGDLADLDGALRLQRHDDQVALLHLVGEGPHLARPVDDGLGLVIGVALLHGMDQRGSIGQLAEIDVQAVPGDVDPVVLEELQLVLAVRAGAVQPDGHGLSRPQSVR